VSIVWTEGAGGGERRLVLHHAVRDEHVVRDAGAGLPRVRARGLMEDHSSYQTCIANRPAAIVGHPTGCWRQLVDTWSAWGSNASSVGVSHALTLEECRFSWLGSQT
jgi:hypothetical protein